MAGDNLGNKEGPAFLELTVWETVGGETPNDGDDKHEMGYTKARRGPKRKEEPGKSLW